MPDDDSNPLLALPTRETKPRETGITVVIDTGLPTRYFGDLIESHGEFVDFIKFGWGTSLVTKDITDKIKVLNDANVRYYFGGSLFEKSLLQGRFDRFRAFCHTMGCEYVEVSNGTIDLEEPEKVRYVAELSRDFRVISEVGLKDQVRSEMMAPVTWIEYLNADLGAGAFLVTLETRESGTGGLCRSNGELRYGLVEEILTSGVDINRLIIEAPSTYLQNYFVGRVGPNVNLGNIAAADVIGLETIRQGLRSETLSRFESTSVPQLLEDE
ncbi:MAG TPA: phosphosulfolactate synthase [Acidimicrobiales bacterium]|nr:phosphosulfolactate synthase [Acidimicrobiales bacterium]